MNQFYPAAPTRPSTGPDPGSRKRRRWPYIVVAAAVVLAVAGFLGLHDAAGDPAGDSASIGSTQPAGSLVVSEDSAVEQSSTVSAEPPVAGSKELAGPPAALHMLALLPIRDQVPNDGYSRKQFGQSWSDDVTVDGGHNGCDTRIDILRRDLTALQIKPGTQGCLVLSGALVDPYSGQSIAFTRGATSGEVQIDHIVALSDAWRTGAQQLTAARRQDFANDPLNLQAVSGKVNDAKGADDAAAWLPPAIGYRCEYVSRQIHVKTRYSLWVTPAEHDAMATVLPDAGDSPPAGPSSATTAATSG